MSFYPLIKPELLNNAINFARSVKGIIITKAGEEMILHCRRSFLFCEGQPWTKIGSEKFDVPMGSYDGAEICKLVGLYILLIIEGCSMLLWTIWPRNHTSHTKVYFNEFVANVLRDDIGIVIFDLKGHGGC